MENDQEARVKLTNARLNKSKLKEENKRGKNIKNNYEKRLRWRVVLWTICNNKANN